MKVTDIIASRSDDDAPYYTFEIFPPKTAQGTANLLARVDRMIHTLHPSWVHVTWSAGGTTSEKSLDLAKAAKDLGVEVCVHLTCTNMQTAKLDETLDTLKQLGIQNVLALRGDAPRGEEYWVASDPRFKHGSDLVSYIREKHGDYFCIGVAGYPEGHCDSSDKQSDVKYLLDKQEAGADFVVTQLFYDTTAFGKWLEDAKERGLRIPVLPGIMPIQTFQGFSRITHMCRTFIPDTVIQRLEPIKGDDLAVKDYGVELAVDMIQELWQEGIRGFHFCTLNLEKSVQRILENLDWISPTERKSRKRAVNGDASNGQPQDPRLSALRSSSASGNGESRRMTDSPASWDEFPNGRFGDARSPAYGDLDGWGVSLKLTPSEALQKWGAPACNADISQLFVRYLQGTLKAVPWSDEPLRSETNDILPYLVRLNTEKDWWTVGSQPAVDGAPSEDETYGFGPAGGYIYQKSFVEFFCSYDDVMRIQEKADKVEQESRKRKVTFYAGNTESESKSLITNMQTGDANAVTWGVFPGKEIVTTTLIEEMSFTAWKEEAFSIWTEWEHLYPLKTVTRNLLSNLVKDRWLVSVVHHDFKDPNGLWDFLLNE